MLVYGDVERDEDAAEVGADVGQRLRRCHGLDAGLGRHQELVATFIRAGELVQGVLDAQFYKTSSDDIGPLQEAGTGLLRILADAITASWDSGFTEYGCRGWSEHLALLSAAGAIRSKQAEGYAFYALYPEAYLVAARQSGLGPRTTVIGIRSIGASLAAMVASALNAAATYTLRPVGHPFDRRLALGKRLAERLCGGMGDFAIVDEGPGLSGSSFNCVADWLVSQGVAEDRIHFFPSHAGELGFAARADHRQRWSTARKHAVGLDALLMGNVSPAHRLERWVSAVVGPLSGGLVDLSGGAWRAFRAAKETAAADPAMERRKYLASGEHGRWLVKFSGLGPIGEERLALADRLSGAGFTPRPVGLQHGFLITPWIDDDKQAGETVPTGRLADYLVFRAGLPPDRPGADLDQLSGMASYNVEQALGAPAGNRLRAALGDPGHFAPVQCRTDNRLHAWEWVRQSDTWLKLDALDHHASHDLVGCQDIAWDIAGAVVELDLADAAREQLTEDVSSRIGRGLGVEFVTTHILCYLGFQIGLWSMARDRANSADRPAIEAQLRRYLRHPCLDRIIAD